MAIRAATLLAVALTVAGCVGAPSTPTAAPVSPSSSAAPTPSPVPTPTAQPSPVITPQPSPESAFYLRAWYTQALPPSATFSWLPMATIADGQYLDGNVVEGLTRTPLRRFRVFERSGTLYVTEA